MGTEELPFPPPAELEEAKAQKIAVQARSFHLEEVMIKEACKVVFEFTLVSGEVEFACTFVDMAGSLAPYRPVKMLGSSYLLDQVDLPTNGKLRFVFDNNFSMFYGKEVFFRYVVLPA